MDSCDRLKIARSHLGFTQEKLAKTIGLNQANVRDLESGKVKISTLHALALEYKLHINAEWLLTGHGEMFQKDVGHTDIASPAHEELVSYFQNKKLARLINENLIKLEQIKPEALKEINNYIKFKIQDEGGNPDEELVWQELARHLKNGTSGQ
jgi:transcriptional regulator with XRE-family HTH domain